MRKNYTNLKNRAVLCASMLWFGALGSSCDPSALENQNAHNQNATNAVVSFFPPPGTYATAQRVELSTEVKLGLIYYTTDGKDPVVDPKLLYTKPLLITGDGTNVELRAIVDAAGQTSTTVSSGRYIIKYKQGDSSSTSENGGSSSDDVTVISGDGGAGTAVAESDSDSGKSSEGSNSKSDGSSDAVISVPAASAPSMSPQGGNFQVDQTVTLSTSTSGATIYYTLDGSTPTASSTAYTGPIAIAGQGSGAKTTTIKALATASGYTNSEVSSQTYVIEWQQTVATPTLSVSGSTVSITSNVSGAKVRYTTDGSDPDTSSTVTEVNSPASVDISSAQSSGSEINIRAVASKAGQLNSSEVNYGKVAKPSFSPIPNGYSSGQTVSISSATSGATIYYTTNGVDPVVGSSFTSTYSSSLSVNSNAQIKAIAVKSGLNDSSVAVGDFHIGNMVYVATNGTDSTASVNGNAAGSAANPYQSLAYALTQIGTAAAVIHVKEGTYQVSSSGLSITSSNVKALYGGYKSDDWTVRNPELYPTIISGTTNDPTKIMYLTTGAHVVDGFTIISADNYNNTAQLAVDIGSGAAIVRNNKIRAALGVGSSPSPNDTLTAVRVAGSAGVVAQILNNDISTGDDYNGTRYFFGVFVSSGNPIIFNNVINTSGVAVNGNWGVAISGGNPTIINNTIFFGYAASSLMSFGVGAYWMSSATTSVTIENNIIFNNGSSTYGTCIYSYQSSNYPASVKNNLLFNCPEGFYVNDNATSANTVISSISTLNSQTGMADNMTKPSGTSFSTYYSLLFTNPPDATTSRYGWASPNTTPSPTIPNINFRLKSGSDADLDDVRTGGKAQNTTTYPGLAGDRDGVMRTTDWSIGAFEKD